MFLYYPHLKHDVDFGPVFCAPGALGFDGEGYRLHRALRFLGMTWSTVGFAAKTITRHPNGGNMPIRDRDSTPIELLPRCIVAKPWSGHMLNAVRLSNHGIGWYIDRGYWRKQARPFFLSFMSLAKTSAERLEELRQFVILLGGYLKRNLLAPVALQLNFACPSSGHDFDELFQEIRQMLDIAQELGIPLVINFNPLVPTEVAAEAAEHSACSALWIGNTIPWGEKGIDWQHIFGTAKSPLIERGFGQAGGLSGPACLAFTIEKVAELRAAGVSIPIVAGNGIQHSRDVRELKAAGASAIAIGTVAILRPWRMRSIIRTAWDEFGLTI